MPLAGCHKVQKKAKRIGLLFSTARTTPSVEPRRSWQEEFVLSPGLFDTLRPSSRSDTMGTKGSQHWIRR
ncbi:hypothetical protein CaCOL14_010291 [Colletotrichum acutatum]